MRRLLPPHLHLGTAIRSPTGGPQPALTSACFWDVLDTCLCREQTLARLDSTGARMGAATRAHAAVAQLSPSPAFICFSAHKHIQMGTCSRTAKGVACLRSQSHLSEHQREQGEAPLLIPDSAAASAPVAVEVGPRIIESWNGSGWKGP